MRIQRSRTCAMSSEIVRGWGLEDGSGGLLLGGEGTAVAAWGTAGALMDAATATWPGEGGGGSAMRTSRTYYCDTPRRSGLQRSHRGMRACTAKNSR